MSIENSFEDQRNERIESLNKNTALNESAQIFFEESVGSGYSYNFTWLGFPIIQYPQDLIALQEIIFKTKPNCIIETGFARGGSAIFYSSILENIFEDDKVKKKVISIDISINKEALKSLRNSKYSDNIFTLEGSSTSKKIEEEVASLITKEDRIMVVLDSMHTHNHVLNELKIFAKYVSSGCYLCVMDTAISYLPDKFSSNRPWSRANSPMTALKEFLKIYKNFNVDTSIDNKLAISVAKKGYLIKS